MGQEEYSQVERFEALALLILDTVACQNEDTFLAAVDRNAPKEATHFDYYTEEFGGTVSYYQMK